MHLREKTTLGWYFKIFDFVAQNRLRNNDVDPREIHANLVAVLTTGVLMWAYAILASVSISSPVPGIVGIVCSLVHLLAPVCYLLSSSTYLVTNVILLSGIIHQTTFAYYTGGFDSNILIWYGILPMIAGISSGRKGGITWFIISILVSLVFFILYLSDYQFPYLITETGHTWSQGLLVFGWIFLSSTIVVVYSSMREHTEHLLHKQGHKIDDLFRVLFHDLANPLGRITIGLSIARRQLPNGEKNRGLDIATQAADSMMEITQNIRKMYAVSKGKANVDLAMNPLNTTVDYIQKVYAPELEQKKIQVHYDAAKNSKLHLLVEPVSFNNQVIGNILSNAIKFSPEGSTILISAYKINDEQCAIDITDQGIGIPQALLGSLFDLSKKTTRPGTSGEQGTGFGMHIMKSFVEMYGGKVEIESREIDSGPSGTTVRIILKSSWK